MELEKERIPQIQREIERVERECENKLLAAELHERKQNLLMYGMQTTTNEDVEDIAKKKIAS